MAGFFQRLGNALYTGFNAFFGNNNNSSLGGTINNALTNNQFVDAYNNVQNTAASVNADSHELWAREDSAYQRMVEDMTKAGLNPWTGISSGGLAAGSNIPAMDSLSSVLSTFDNYLSYADTIRQYFGTGSQIANDTADTVLKFAKFATGLAGSVAAL